ncbi:S-phase kinase-associated protein 1-like [Sabethes cyaneus]|uniref:S-phase kinase-associated protein 1-like n=1 Tax=Sabethes cyaneus TaxID=53552 RepID=UPI00237DB7D9|nr:S-phase kinase-associated protein 1-like [Sabethes cyaneus]
MTLQEKEDGLLLPNVDSNVLRLVLEWCTEHKDDPEPDTMEEDRHLVRPTDDIGEWDKQFLDAVDGRLVELLVAADYLHIGSLLDLCVKTVANMLKGKTAEQIRSEFQIENGFPPEVEAQLRLENELLEEK